MLSIDFEQKSTLHFHWASTWNRISALVCVFQKQKKQKVSFFFKDKKATGPNSTSALVLKKKKKSFRDRLANEIWQSFKVGSVWSCDLCSDLFPSDPKALLDSVLCFSSCWCIWFRAFHFWALASNTSKEDESLRTWNGVKCNFKGYIFCLGHSLNWPDFSYKSVGPDKLSI